MKKFITLLMCLLVLFVWMPCVTAAPASAHTFASGTSASSGAGTAKPAEPAEAPALQEPTEQAPEAEERSGEKERPEEPPPFVSTSSVALLTEMTRAMPQSDAAPQTTVSRWHTTTRSCDPTPAAPVVSTPASPLPGPIAVFPDLTPKKPEASVPARLLP